MLAVTRFSAASLLDGDRRLIFLDDNLDVAAGLVTAVQLQLVVDAVILDADAM